MNHMFKRVALLATVSVLMVPVSGFASGFADQNVVRDVRGNIVKNTFGNCVRTKWVVGNDACAPAPAPMPRHAMVPPPPPAPAPMYAAPVQPPVEESRAFLVFFDFDKSNITSDAMAIIKTAYKQASNGAKKAMFNVIGHADRSGSDKYNMNLSKKRANNVTSQLEQLGIPKENIHVDYRGEREPLVPTDDGVKEPQNRRAEIKYYYE